MTARKGWVAPRNGGYQAVGPARQPGPPPPGPGSPSRRFDPSVVPVEWTTAVMRAMTRRRYGPLATVLSDETIIETARDAAAVLSEVWPLVIAQIEQAQADAAKYHEWWIAARDERDRYAAELGADR